nr:CBS domain protein [uncultured bacterium]
MVPPNVHIQYVDEVVNISDGESFELSRQLGRTEGIFCGGSSGTNLGAALRVARDLDKDAVVVFIICDTGEHYLTKHHSDEWLKSKRLLEPQKMTAGLISGTKAANAPQSLVSVKPEDKLAEALSKMDELGLTQIPVLEEGKPVGSLRENRVLAKVVRSRHLLEAAVSEVMEESFPVVDVDASAQEVTQRLQSSPAVLIEEYGRITGIITRHDVLDLKLGNTGSLA